jgi:DNA-binding GntR family transcriptional regulator
VLVGIAITPPAYNRHVAARGEGDVRDGYAALRRAILTGRFGPNERLIEAEISGEFGMPRGAVRTAFVRLEVEGLLRREPNKGARMRLVTDEEAIQIMHTRAVLEGLLARRAAERVTAAEARRLSAVARRYRAFVDGGDVLASANANLELHELIRHIAREPVPSQLVEQLNSRITRFQFRTAVIPGRPAATADEHDTIVDAIVSRDPGRSERAMRHHLTNVAAALQRTTAAER